MRTGRDLYEQAKEIPVRSDSDTAEFVSRKTNGLDEPPKIPP